MIIPNIMATKGLCNEKLPPTSDRHCRENMIANPTVIGLQSNLFDLKVASPVMAPRNIDPITTPIVPEPRYMYVSIFSPDCPTNTSE